MTTIDSNAAVTAPDVTTPEGRLAAAKAKMKANRSAQPKKAKAKVKAKAKPKSKPKAKAKPAAKAKAAKPEPRTGTKQAKVIEMLKSPKGATYAEIAKRMEWLPHTTRAMVSVALEKKLGLKIDRAADDERGMVLRIK